MHLQIPVLALFSSPLAILALPSATRVLEAQSRSFGLVKVLEANARRDTTAYAAAGVDNSSTANPANHSAIASTISSSAVSATPLPNHAIGTEAEEECEDEQEASSSSPTSAAAQATPATDPVDDEDCLDDKSTDGVTVTSSAVGASVPTQAAAANEDEECEDEDEDQSGMEASPPSTTPSPISSISVTPSATGSVLGNVHAAVSNTNAVAAESTNRADEQCGGVTTVYVTVTADAPQITQAFNNHAAVSSFIPPAPSKSTAASTGPVTAPTNQGWDNSKELYDEAAEDYYNSLPFCDDEESVSSPQPLSPPSSPSTTRSASTTPSSLGFENGYAEECEDEEDEDDYDNDELDEDQAEGQSQLGASKQHSATTSLATNSTISTTSSAASSASITTASAQGATNSTLTSASQTSSASFNSTGANTTATAVGSSSIESTSSDFPTSTSAFPPTSTSTSLSTETLVTSSISPMPSSDSIGPKTLTDDPAATQIAPDGESAATSTGAVTVTAADALPTTLRRRKYWRG